MFNKKYKKLITASLALMVVFVAGCSSTDDKEETPAGETSLGEQLDYTITGIDAGAGVVAAAEQAMEDYDLEYKVQTSSGAAMTQALSDAIANEEPIIVTGWNPHWKFSKYDLKYLEDPKGSFGEAENINTIARMGLEADMPEAYQVLDNFAWSGEDMENVMVQINEGGEPEEVAREWVDNNTDKTSVWIDGVSSVDGDEINLAYVAWDTEIASTNVVGAVLSDLGYDVTLTQVENGPMWEAVASGNTDAIVAAWLPATHADHYANFEDEVINLGPNLKGAAIGLIVPAYMDIDSIEDLAKK